MQLQRKKSFYEKYIKRVLDIVCALLALIFTGWLFIIIAIIVRIKMGSPVLFKQPRPGMVDPKTGREKIFDMYKFRSMTDVRDEEGNLLPDNQRLPKFGAMLRSTSLDELPEVFCILKGDMSVIGPRPQLVRDMVFMSDEQRMRHTAKPGLTGLAQVRGRNAVTWEEKLNWDLNYIDKVSFLGDLKILFETIVVVFKRSGITDGENVTALDFGDALLKEGKIDKTQYIPGVGVDINRIKEVKVDRKEYKKSIGIPEDCVMLLSVGEMIERKNHQVIIKALGKLKRDDIYYVICGKGPLKEELEQLSNSLGVHTVFLGFRRDIPELCNTADISAFPSRIEGLGLAGIEAMAAGVPLVSSNVHGILDYVIDGKTGYARNPEDVDGFATAIEKLVNSEELRAGMKEACLKAVEPFEISNALNAMWDIYREII